MIPPIRIAKSREEYCEAASLLYSRYTAKKIIPPGVRQAHMSLHTLLGPAQLFIHNRDGFIVETSTVFFDSPAWGLPADALYREEIDELRKDGKVVEIGELASAGSSTLDVRELLRYAYWSAEKSGARWLICQCSPRRGELYRRAADFENAGATKAFSNGCQAVLMRLKLPSEAGKKKARWHDYFARHPLSKHEVLA